MDKLFLFQRNRNRFLLLSNWPDLGYMPILRPITDKQEMVGGIIPTGTKNDQEWGVLCI